MTEKYKKGKWDADEDINLVYLYALEKRRSPHAVSWAVIAKSMENRTPDQCRVHFKVLVDNKSVCRIACYIRQRQAFRFLAFTINQFICELPSIEDHKKIIS